MENTKKITGVFFNEEDIKRIVDRYLEWAEIVPGQVFCADNIMSDTTPIGTSIMVGVDGIRCNEGSNILNLILSSGIYELKVKTESTNDRVDIRFTETLPIPGTFGFVLDGQLDILTDEEKEFEKMVNDMLGERDDEYANLFRNDNKRNIGGRGLLLLEKIKQEIKADHILKACNITPSQLTAVFIDLTGKYVTLCKSLKETVSKHDELIKQKETYSDYESKAAKKLLNDIEFMNEKINSELNESEFCLQTINAAVMPVLNIVIER